MSELARAGYTSEEIRAVLESDTVQASVRVELQDGNGVPIRNLRNVTGGKATLDADRDIRMTLQVALEEPAGIGDDFDDSRSIKDYSEYGPVALYSMTPGNEGELTARGGNLTPVIHNSFIWDDVAVECDISRADAAG